MHWANLEKIDDFHQTLCRCTGLSCERSMMRFMSVETKQRRISVMNHLFYHILSDYYIRPSSAREFTLGPLLRASSAGMGKDYCLLTTFIFENCPTVSSMIIQSWGDCVLSLLPTIIDLFSSLISTDRFVLVLDFLFNLHSAGFKSTGSYLCYLCCSFMKKFEDFLKESSNAGIDPLITPFNSCLADFSRKRSDEIFSDFFTQLREAPRSDPSQSSRGVISNIFTTIQDAVSSVNTMKLSHQHHSSILENARISSYISHNNILTALSITVFDVGQKHSMSVDRVVGLVEKAETRHNRYLYIKMVEFGTVVVDGDRAEGKKLDVLFNGLDAKYQDRYKVLIGLKKRGGSQGEGQKKKVLVGKREMGKVVEILVGENEKAEVAIELVETDPFDVYRFPKDVACDEATVSMERLQRNQVQNLSLKMRNKRNLNEEFFIHMHVLCVDAASLETIKEVTRYINAEDDLMSTPDRAYIEKKNIVEQEDKAAPPTTASCLLSDLKETGYIDLGTFKSPVSSLEASINRKYLESLSRVFDIGDSRGISFNYFARSRLLADPTINHTDIIRNLSSVPGLSKASSDISMKTHNHMSSFSIVLRLLLFNKDPGVLVTYLMKYFDREKNGILASDLVHTMGKIMEILHFKPHCIEVSDYLETKLDKKLRPRLVSCTCVLANIDSEGVTISKEIYDITHIVEQVVFWMSFKYNCPKLVLGDDRRLYVVEEILRKVNPALRIETLDNFVSIETEHNGYLFKRIIHFDRAFNVQPDTSPVSDFEDTNNSIARELFSLERFSVDLRPLTNLTISRLELDRLFFSSEYLSYIHDISKI